MSELTTLRDHCRQMATTSTKTAAALQRELDNAQADGHAIESAVDEWLTKARRDHQLWTQIADEIDERLTDPDDAPATETDAPLWEMP